MHAPRKADLMVKEQLPSVAAVFCQKTKLVRFLFPPIHPNILLRILDMLLARVNLEIFHHFSDVMLG